MAIDESRQVMKERSRKKTTVTVTLSSVPASSASEISRLAITARGGGARGAAACKRWRRVRGGGMGSAAMAAVAVADRASTGAVANTGWPRDQACPREGGGGARAYCRAPWRCCEGRSKRALG
eukprot:2515973-Prymnesium_polylepis.1